jgi:hypothetical protein
MPKNKKKYTAEEEAYVNKLMSHGMDRIRAEWYLNAMKTWTDEDYDNYNAYHMWMFGEFGNNKALAKAESYEEFCSLYKKRKLTKKKAPKTKQGKIR